MYLTTKYEPSVTTKELVIDSSTGVISIADNIGSRTTTYTHNTEPVYSESNLLDNKDLSTPYTYKDNNIYLSYPTIVAPNTDVMSLQYGGGTLTSSTAYNAMVFNTGATGWHIYSNYRSLGTSDTEPTKFEYFIYASGIGINNFTLNVVVGISYYTFSTGYVGESTVTYTGLGIRGTNISNWEKIGGFISFPAGTDAKLFRLKIGLSSDGYGLVTRKFLISLPYVGKIPITQTTFSSPVESEVALINTSYSYSSRNFSSSSVSNYPGQVYFHSNQNFITMKTYFTISSVTFPAVSRTVYNWSSGGGKCSSGQSGSVLLPNQSVYTLPVGTYNGTASAQIAIFTINGVTYSSGYTINTGASSRTIFATLDTSTNVINIGAISVVATEDLPALTLNNIEILII